MKRSLIIITVLCCIIAYSCKKESNSSTATNSTTITPTPGPDVTDIDGNVYHSVIIGTQTWMAENLRTTRFNDGTPIQLVTDSTTWMNLTTPAYCWYNNDVSKKSSYGALYNWYVVNMGSLAPVGWHVSTSAEWTTLNNYLGGDVRDKLCETGTAHWMSPNQANNSSGFTALPGGCRYGYNNGEFVSIRNLGLWWTTTEESSYDAWNVEIDYGSGPYIDYYYKQCGYSVRCLRNAPVLW